MQRAKTIKKYEKLARSTGGFSYHENNQLSESEEEKAPPKLKGIMVKNNKKEHQESINFDEEEEHYTERDLNYEEEDLEEMRMRKYMLQNKISIAAKPLKSQENYGKKSEMDYIKEIAFYRQNLRKLGENDIIKESNKQSKRT